MPKSNEVNVLLIRAGATSWDEAGRLVGATDLPLCDQGRAVVAERIATLNGTPLATLLHGPDEASTETAALVADGRDVRIRKVDGLHEISLGLWEGLLGADLEDKYPTAWKQWNEDPGSVLAPEGESVGEARDRLVAELCRVLDKHRNGGGVGVVLRPVAYGLVTCWLEDEPTSKLWSILDDCPGMKWHSVTRDRLRSIRDQSRARV